MIKVLIAILLAFTFASGQKTKEISDTQKKVFIELLKTLPTKGEFFTDEAIEKASPYLRVLFAFTEEDIDKYDIYPFVALSRGLCDRKEQREYAVKHFSEIQHPRIKLFWGAMLFDEKSPSREIVQFLRKALESEEQTKVLSEALGPNFEDFKARVKAHPNYKN